MRYKHARNAVAAGIAAALVVTVGPTAADAAVHFGAHAPTGTTDTHADFVPGESDIIDSFYDGSGIGVLLRRGYWIRKSGYGWEKIKAKHALANLNVIRGVIRNPNGGEFDSRDPKVKIYQAMAEQDECVVGVGCRPVRALPVRAIVDFNEAAHYPEVLGVKTVYCVNPDGSTKCPLWVNRIKRVEY